MRKLIVSTYTTLDGVIQPLDWSGQSSSEPAVRERGAYARDLIFEADALLLGRETYEIFAEAWSSRTAADDGPGEEGFIDRINSLPKHVASTTLNEPLTWNASLITGDVPAEVARLKQQPGQAILMFGTGDPDVRVRPARANPRGARSDRRISILGVSRCPRGRNAPVR
jgi:dihydrofolate reductase